MCNLRGIVQSTMYILILLIKKKLISNIKPLRMKRMKSIFKCYNLLYKENDMGKVKKIYLLCAQLTTFENM